MTYLIAFSWYFTKAVKIFTKVVVLLIFLFSVFIATANLLGRPTFLAVSYGYSMFPVLKPGELVLTIPEPLVGKVSNGSIIVFRDPDYGKIPGYPPYISHQVVDILPNGTYITKGINDNFVDQIYMPPLNNSQIYAEVVTINGNPVVLPYLGQVLETVRSNLLISFSGLTLIAIVIGSMNKKNNRIVTSKGVIVFFIGLFIFSAFVIMSSTSTSSFTTVYSVSSSPGYLFGGTLTSPSVNLQVLLYNQTKSYTFNVTDKLIFPEVVEIDVLGGNGFNITPTTFILYPHQTKMVNLTVVGQGSQGLHTLIIKSYSMYTLLPIILNISSSLYSMFIYSALSDLLLLAFIAIPILRGD
ncbi:hypothetical protein GWK48_07430 [Metallosphaera tengchongensis]|uniref:Signal peptidase I n=1 Tax=Metallosphaera tengchongensis TaxID=1532350 RepID=A0A6N0NVJ1_9CREN|nr:S24/S26 family peptidase [Metallosphaera tengchongensis]QKR00227.1 hypothetical protein GWK48_07430 [Metallosphaera tengchongensis]